LPQALAIFYEKFSLHEAIFSCLQFLCLPNAKITYPLSPQIGVGRGNKYIERPTMKIETSDKKTIDGFEKIQNIAKAVQGTTGLQSIANVNSKEVRYKGYVLNANNSKELTAKISSVLEDMSLCNWQGKIYSGEKGVYLRDFAEHLNFLLAWLRSFKKMGKQSTISVGVESQQMRNALAWLISAMKHTNIRLSADVACVNGAIGQLRREEI
jgi:hypothetical protein